MIRAVLLASAVLLAGCATDPPSRTSYARPVSFPEPWDQPKAPAPTPAPTPPPAAPAADASGSDYASLELVAAVPAAGLLGAKLATDRAKTSPPVGEGSGVRPALAAGETETAAGSAAAAEGRTGAGFMARLRANSALRAIAGVGGEEVVGATAASGLARFALRGVIVPIVAGIALYEFMQSN